MLYPNRDEQTDTIITVVSNYYNMNFEDFWKPNGDRAITDAKKYCIWLLFEKVRGVSATYLSSKTGLSVGAINNHLNTKESLLKHSDTHIEDYEYLKTLV